MFEGYYIEGCVIPKNNYINFDRCEIDTLILRGHDLLDNIRPETVWKETKSVMQKVGDFSLGILSQVAGETMAAYTTGELVIFLVEMKSYTLVVQR